MILKYIELEEAFKRNLPLCKEMRRDIILLILKEILHNEFTDERFKDNFNRLKN